jgi:signal transduction histidine kinase
MPMKKNCLLLITLLAYFITNGQNIDSLKKLLNEPLHDTIRMGILTELAMYTNFDRIEYPFYDFALLKLCEKKHYKVTTSELYCTNYYLAQATTNIGTYLLNQNKNDSALILFNKALSIATEIKSKPLISDISSILGSVYNEIMMPQKAIFYCYNALKIDESLKDTLRIINSMNTLASVYRTAKQNDKMFEYALKSYNMCQYKNDDELLSICLTNLSYAYLNLNKVNESILLLNKALEISKKNSNKRETSSNLNGLGNCYSLLKDFDQASKHYYEALVIAKINKIIPLEQAILINLSKLYTSKQEQKKAHSFALQAYELSLKINLNTKVEGLKILSQTYYNIGDYKNSIELLKNYYQLKDSADGLNIKTSLIKSEFKNSYERKQLMDSTKNAQEKIYTAQINSAKLAQEHNQKLLYASIALLAILSVGFVFYQYKQKQKTNAQLQTINDKINKQNNTLKTLNKELIVSEENLQKSNSTKEQLISMISHDLLNPITAITNYNQVIIQNKTKNEDLLSAFKNVDAAIQPMHSLLDNMLQWSAIQKDGVQAKLKLQDVNEIIKEIIGIYRPQANLKFIKLADSLAPNFVLETDKSILSLILRNLLNNAIKYSGNNTQIKIGSNTHTKTIYITDEGFGMTDEMITNLNAKQLHKIESKGTGLGLKLCFEFAEAINTRLLFSKNESTGTTVEIKLNDV